MLYLTLYIVSNEEKLLKKSCKILNNIILRNITNFQVKKQQLALNRYLK